MRKKLGIHIIMEFIGCESSLLNNTRFLKRVFKEAVEISGLIAIKYLVHKFKPGGVSILTFLAASHISLHSWPEYGYAAIDIYSCDPDESKAFKAMEVFKERLKPRKVKKIVIERGF